ncbi:inorganic triphosphatase [Pasteurella sp. PK-2025]|uniref:CYTH domain-containing protein n=1 Tax=Pasteurella sp. PK-2025 TaxID=3413133 RepID=UPI003C74D161
MSNEIELKLSVNPEFVDFLNQVMSTFVVHHQQSQFLANCYYDSQDQFFARQKMGLRVRQENDRFTLTLKTDGQVQGGLHIRPEYNVELADAKPDLALLVEKTGLTLGNIEALELQPIFSTDFERKQWLVECGNGALIEVAFDFGHIYAGEKTAPICEVEFELKAGNTTDLLRFVSNLTLEQGVRLSSASKAKRGYQLAKPQAQRSLNWLDKWRDFLQLEQTDNHSLSKLTALFALEQGLIEETFALGQGYFESDFLATVQRISAFFNLYHYYTEHAKLLQEVFQTQQQDLVDEQDFMELIEQQHGLFNAIKEIIRLHSETQDNALALNKLFQLLQTGQYVKRMLHFISLTMSQ